MILSKMSRSISHIRGKLARSFPTNAHFFNSSTSGRPPSPRAAKITPSKFSSQRGNFSSPFDSVIMHTLNVDPKLPHDGLNVRTLHTLKTPSNPAIDEAVYEQLSTFLPPSDHPEFATRQKWLMHLITHKFTVAADFVAQVSPTARWRSNLNMCSTYGY